MNTLDTSGNALFVATTYMSELKERMMILLQWSIVLSATRFISQCKKAEMTKQEIVNRLRELEDTADYLKEQLALLQKEMVNI